MSHFIYCYAECHYAECRYAECRTAACHGAFFVIENEGATEKGIVI